MSSFPPLRRMYSSLSYSLSSSDEPHDCDSSGIVEKNRKSSPRNISRYSFVIRLAIFVLLESGFTALASTALRRPIILDISFRITEVKSTVTALAILWHSIAVFIVKDILLNVFSAEWSEQHNRSHSLTLRELDIVSRLTTGLIDQVKHCLSRRATHSFRLAFLSTLLLIPLNGLGPSAISVDHAAYVYPHTIQVANLSAQAPSESDVQENHSVLGSFPIVMQSRIRAFIELEVVENSTTLGFTSMQPNILIPWPSSDFISGNMTIKYPSDVIRSNFSCSWNMPSFRDSTSTVTDGLMAANDEWQIQSVDHNLDLGIYPLTQVDISLETDVFIAFLWVASDSVSEEVIPSLRVPCNTTQNPSFRGGHDRGCLDMWLSVLVCNPQFEVLPAMINATGFSLEATVLPGMPTVKNAPILAVDYIFLYSFILADPWEPGAELADRLFFPISDFTMNDEGRFKPLSLPDINRNMTNFLASAAKAYLGGYTPNDHNFLLPSFAMVNTSRELEVLKMALVGSKPFFIAFTVIVTLLVPLLGALVVITRPDQLERLELENIVEKSLNIYPSDSCS